MMVDITNTRDLKARLDKLNEYAQPQWGRLDPQQMIEHLTSSFPIVNGRKEMQQITTAEEAEAVKAKLVHSAEPMARGIKSAMMGENPPPHIHPNLQTAKDDLLKEVEEFNTNRQKNPAGTAVHPRMGRMNYEEWAKLFNKHFTHHFEQYDLMN